MHGLALAPTLTDAVLRSLKACGRLYTGVEGGAATPTTGRDAKLSPLCATQPLALPPHALQASLSKHPTPAERYRTQLPPLPPLFPLDRKPRMAPYQGSLCPWWSTAPCTTCCPLISPLSRKERRDGSLRSLSLVSQQANNTLHTHQLSHTLEHLITSPHHRPDDPRARQPPWWHRGTPRRQ